MSNEDSDRLTPSELRARALHRKLGNDTVLVGSDGLSEVQVVAMTPDEITSFKNDLRPAASLLLEAFREEHQGAPQTVSAKKRGSGLASRFGLKTRSRRNSTKLK